MKVDYFFRSAVRRIQARFQEATIERHEARWMAAVYKRRDAERKAWKNAIGNSE